MFLKSLATTLTILICASYVAAQDLVAYRDEGDIIRFELPPNGLVDRREDHVTLHSFAGGVSISVTKRKMRNPRETVRAYKLSGLDGSTAVNYENDDFLIRRLDETRDGEISISLYIASQNSYFSIGITGERSAPQIDQFLRTIRFGKYHLPPYSSAPSQNEHGERVIFDKLPISPEVDAARLKSLTKIKPSYATLDGLLPRKLDILSRNLVFVERPKAEYTAIARAKNMQGAVRVDIEFLKTGEIGEVVIDSSADRGLAKLVVSAVSKIKFVPAQANGVPIDVTRTLIYTFSIY